jgi:hypothetical protein
LLRKQRRTFDRIADETGVSRATVGRILMRHGLNRWRDLEPQEPVIRYERDKPGEMVHIDIKKLGKFNRTGHRITGDRHGQSNARGIGWEFVHVCVDDHSRIAFSQVLASERKECAMAFLKAAVLWYQGLGIKIDRVMLSFQGIQQALQSVGHPPYLHKTLHPENQWQSRALHPVIVARMGLCSSLQYFRTTKIRITLLAAPLQLAQAACWYKQKNTNQPIRLECEQPIETPHLDQVMF